MFHKTLKRVSETRLSIQHDFDFKAQLFANAEVPLERSVVDELLRFLSVANTVQALSPKAQIQQVALTPDFHKGSGIPVGTVMKSQGFLLPQAMGNDIGCGMRLHTTGLSKSQLEPHLDQLEGILRHLFFQGGRNIPLTGLQRQALLQEGVSGLLNSVPSHQQEGLWALFHSQNLALEVQHTETGVGLPVRQVLNVEDWFGPLKELSRDAQIGSLGGGNHFVELQYIHKILEPQRAYAWGLREGQITVMVHSGSVGFGHLFGRQALQMAQKLYPQQGKAPEHGFYPLLAEHAEAVQSVLDGINAAAHFAVVNRLFLALMARAALEQVTALSEFPLVYDAPHNFIWPEGEQSWLHRKGATPARGFEELQQTPFAYTGEPVLVPGSMGASSFVLAGGGSADALHSASHGAGRQQARGEAMRVSPAEFDQFLEDFRVVTPLDWKSARSDIRKKKLEELKQEAPFAYKGIGPIIDTLEQSQIAQPVAELRPLLTVKG